MPLAGKALIYLMSFVLSEHTPPPDSSKNESDLRILAGYAKGELTKPFGMPFTIAAFKNSGLALCLASY